MTDSRSVEPTESGGFAGYDAGKTVRARKRHVHTDPPDLLVTGIVHAADVQDCGEVPDLPARVHEVFPRLRHPFAGGVYAGDKLTRQLPCPGNWTFEIVRRTDTANGFQVLPKRRLVERTLAWLNRNQRLGKDFGTAVASVEDWLYPASIQPLIRRVAGTRLRSILFDSDSWKRDTASRPGVSTRDSPLAA